MRIIFLTFMCFGILLGSCKPKKNEEKTAQSETLQMALLENVGEDSSLNQWEILNKLPRLFAKSLLLQEEGDFSWLNEDIMELKVFDSHIIEQRIKNLSGIWAPMQFIKLSQFVEAKFIQDSTEERLSEERFVNDQFAYQEILNILGAEKLPNDVSFIEDLTNLHDIDSNAFMEFISVVSALRKDLSQEISHKNILRVLLKYQTDPKVDKFLKLFDLDVNRINELQDIYAYRSLVFSLSMPDDLIPEFVLFAMSSESGLAMPYFFNQFLQKSIYIKFYAILQNYIQSSEGLSGDSEEDRIQLLTRVFEFVHLKILDRVSEDESVIQAFISIMNQGLHYLHLGPREILDEFVTDTQSNSDQSRDMVKDLIEYLNVKKKDILGTDNPEVFEFENIVELKSQTYSVGWQISKGSAHDFGVFQEYINFIPSERDQADLNQQWYLFLESQM